MNKVISSSIILLSILLPQFSLALPTATSAVKSQYPNTCPAEAIAIVNSVGGCAAVSQQTFPAVYEKCCRLPTSTLTPTPAPVPAPAERSSTSSYIVYVAIAAAVLIGFLMIKKNKKE